MTSGGSIDFAGLTLSNSNGIFSPNQYNSIQEPVIAEKKFVRKNEQFYETMIHTNKKKLLNPSRPGTGFSKPQTM